MKKITLMIALLLLWGASFSQKFNKVYRSIYSTYDYGEWVTKDSRYPQSMYITLDGSDIMINNDAESHYKTYGNSSKSTFESHECYTWNCIDRKGISCLFMMKRFYESGTYVFCFVYRGYMFEYVIENE